MKALKAINDLGAEEVALSDIIVGDKESVVAVAPHWAIFQRQYLIALDICKHGLKNPILVKRKSDKFAYVASGCRIQYAVLNGYTHIDAIICESDEQVKHLMLEMAKYEESFLPEELIELKQRIPS